jgi:hypothetical protein
MSDAKRHTFAIPADADEYAPTELMLDEGAGDRPIYDLSVLVESLPADAVIEVWLLRVGGTAGTEGHWINSGTAYDAVGLGALLMLGAWPGVKLRGKSGGTAGNSIISASWD